MMNTAELIALRSRLIAAYANRHSFGAADAYVQALEAEVELANFKSRKGSVKHLIALVDAVIEARQKLPPKQTKPDFHYRTSQAVSMTPEPPPPLRGKAETVVMIDEQAFSTIEHADNCRDALCGGCHEVAPSAIESKPAKTSKPAKKSRGGKPAKQPSDS